MACLQTPAATATVPTPPPPAELLWMNSIGTNDIALSKDGQYVAAVGPAALSSDLAFYGRSSGTPMWTYTVEDVFGSVAISADGDCVAAGNGSRVFFWKNAKSRTPGNTDPTWTSENLNGPIEYRCLDISDDGSFLVAVAGLSVYYWENAKGKSSPPSVAATWTYTSPGKVRAVDLSSDGDYVAAGVYVSEVAYWKGAKTLPTGSHSPAWASMEPSGPLVDVAVSDDGDYVAAAAMVDTVYYWADAGSRTGTDEPSTWYGGLGVEFLSMDMSSDGNSVIAGTFGPNAKVYFWGGAKGLSHKPQDPSWTYTTAGTVHDVAINAAGDYMAAANDVATPYVYFFDSTGDLKWTYDLISEMAHVLSISSDGGTLAIGTGAITSRFLVSTGYRTPTRAVGGVLLPADKLALISPRIAVALAALAITVFATKRRRKP